MINTDGFNLTYEVFKHCNHKGVEIRKRTLNQGVIQYVKQCSYCGKSMSLAIKKDVAINENKGVEPNPFDEKLRSEYNAFERYEIYGKRQEEREIERKSQELDRQIQEEASKVTKDEFFAKYSKYLSSNEWFDKRDKVMNRANGICEGCREKKADHVHHLTYTHVFNELLFELVAVCKECHSRIHPDKSF